MPKFIVTDTKYFEVEAETKEDAIQQVFEDDTDWYEHSFNAERTGEKNTHVVRQRPGSSEIEVLGEFYSVAEGEAFVEEMEKVDPEGVARGDYGVEGPADDTED